MSDAEEKNKKAKAAPRPAGKTPAEKSDVGKVSVKASPAAGVRKAVVVTHSLHIRKDHDAASEEVGGLKEGDEVDVIGSWSDGSDKWAKLGEGKWVAMEHNGQVLMKFKE